MARTYPVMTTWGVSSAAIQIAAVDGTRRGIIVISAGSGVFIGATSSVSLTAAGSGAARADSFVLPTNVPVLITEQFSEDPSAGYALWAIGPAGPTQVSVLELGG